MEAKRENYRVKLVIIFQRVRVSIKERKIAIYLVNKSWRKRKESVFQLRVTLVHKHIDEEERLLFQYVGFGLL